MTSGRDDRKTAAIAAQRAVPDQGAPLVRSFAAARDILRSASMIQGGLGADQVDSGDPTQIPVFFLDGEIHHRRRIEISRYFTTKAINTRYRQVMENTTAKLLAELQAEGRGFLDQISFQLAVKVAASIVGLTESGLPGMSARIRATLVFVSQRHRGLDRMLAPIMQRIRALNFFVRDVRPAIKARRAKRGDDIISQLIDKGYSDPGILIDLLGTRKPRSAD